MANIYEITDKYKFIQQLIEDGAPEEAFIEALNAIDGELAEKLENYASVMKNIESDIAGIKAEEGRLAERRKAMENSIKRMKENMQLAMDASGEKKLKGEKFTFTVQKNPPSLKVLDDAVIPPQYISVEEVRNIDKKAILAELKNGAEISGVEIQQGESIRIR
ncbi:MAG: siphovirus Gp157 family protein [Solibacillus sp.]|uniref:siphovirus Gp157 family protein n=1 Tax=Solibacillus sp. TaxID=1909654 RepID=UPI0033146C90